MNSISSGIKRAAQTVTKSISSGAKKGGAKLKKAGSKASDTLSKVATRILGKPGKSSGSALGRIFGRKRQKDSPTDAHSPVGDSNPSGGPRGKMKLISLDQAQAKQRAGGGPEVTPDSLKGWISAQRNPTKSTTPQRPTFSPPSPPTNRSGSAVEAQARGSKRAIQDAKNRKKNPSLGVQSQPKRGSYPQAAVKPPGK